MSKIQKLNIAIFIIIIVGGIYLWFYVARHTPSRDFALLCLLTAGYLVLGLVLFKIFAEKIRQDRRFQILLELLLAVVFVAAFYWFGAYVSPGK